MWSAALEQHGHTGSGLSGTPIAAPLQLWSCILRRRRPNVYIFRYLNDYVSLTKTIVRMISEAAVIVTCWLFDIKIFWILHNVDRESFQYWPALSRLRRKAVALACHRAFVTDSLLINDAKRRFPKVIWAPLSFGVDVERAPEPSGHARIVSALAQLRKKLSRNPHRPAYVGLAVTSLSDKCQHLFRYSELVANLPEWPFVIGLVFVSNFSGGSTKWKSIAERMHNNPYIEIVDVEAKVDETAIADSFDFIYRSLSDLSVPFTVYRAAAVRKPLITHEEGFVARLVSEYGVGIIWSPENVGSVNTFFRTWTRDQWSAFLTDRSWSCASLQLSRSVAGGRRNLA